MSCQNNKIKINKKYYAAGANGMQKIRVCPAIIIIIIIITIIKKNYYATGANGMQKIPICPAKIIIMIMIK
jgi:hypothetical protein